MGINELRNKQTHSREIYNSATQLEGSEEWEHPEEEPTNWMFYRRNGDLGFIQQGDWEKNFCSLKFLLAKISSVGYFSRKALAMLLHCVNDDGALSDSSTYLPQSRDEGEWGPEKQVS